MYKKFGKRTLDLTIATCAIIILALPMLLVTLWIRLDSRGPALFRQKRYGLHREPFTIYKFRTMSLGTPDNRATNDFHDSHAYITRAGHIIRKLSIDELPQLFNVILGDMSIVGPRPVVLCETRIINLREPYGANDIKPGITGHAQAHGRDELDDIAKSKMDGYYTANISLTTDLRCIFRTARIIITRSGQTEGHELYKRNNKLTAEN